MFSHVRFSELMQKNGVTNYKLAQYLGCSQSSVKNWLTSTEPNAEFISKIAKYFDVSVNYLLGLEDEYGLSDSDWSTMGTLFKDTRVSLGFSRDLAVDSEVLTMDTLSAFEDDGAPITPAQLTTACGLIGIDPTVVFGLWSDRLWGQKNSIAAKIDDDALDYAQSVHDRPELKVLFKKGKKATAEKLGAILALLEDGSED